MRRKKWFLILALLIMTLLAISACTQAEDENDTDNPGEKQIEQGDKDQEVENGDEEDNTDEENIAQKIKDSAPEGCASCHKKENEEQDHRLGMEANSIEGHSEIDEDADVNDCMMCHATGDRAFRKVLHRVHLIEGDHYIENYDHNCINCHEISDEGEVTVKGLEKAE